MTHRLVLPYEKDRPAWEIAGTLFFMAFVAIFSVPLLFRLFNFLLVDKQAVPVLSFGLPILLGGAAFVVFSQKGALILDRLAGQIIFQRPVLWWKREDAYPLARVQSVSLVTVCYYQPGHTYYVSLGLQTGRNKLQRYEVSERYEERASALLEAQTLASFLGLPLEEEEKWEPSWN
jgi:hypothetical protein